MAILWAWILLHLISTSKIGSSYDYDLVGFIPRFFQMLLGIVGLFSKQSTNAIKSQYTWLKLHFCIICFDKTYHSKTKERRAVYSNYITMFISLIIGSKQSECKLIYTQVLPGSHICLTHTHTHHCKIKMVSTYKFKPQVISDAYIYFIFYSLNFLMIIAVTTYTAFSILKNFQKLISGHPSSFTDGRELQGEPRSKS